MAESYLPWRRPDSKHYPLTAQQRWMPGIKTLQKEAANSPLKTIRLPTRMTQDKCSLKKRNYQSIQGNDSCLTFNNKSRGQGGKATERCVCMHLRVYVYGCVYMYMCADLCMMLQMNGKSPLLLTVWSLDQQQ